MEKIRALTNHIYVVRAQNCGRSRMEVVAGANGEPNNYKSSTVKFIFSSATILADCSIQICINKINMLHAIWRRNYIRTYFPKAGDFENGLLSYRSLSRGAWCSFTAKVYFF